MAIQNVVTLLVADWEEDHFSDSPPADSVVDHSSDSLPGDLVVVQVYSQRVDSQEVVYCPGPTRLSASKTRRKTELPVTSSA